MDWFHDGSNIFGGYCTSLGERLGKVENEDGAPF